ncbi:uncharacterized protein LOC107366256 [Tetranychus urticae]|uniref:F-box domain-containing protein n=1 Tax=Tetranychus urticae TaxID=32264 RepID=T1JRT8_TETUR|nr:uncharacterized protein LOC107366256 [Tetranychus urticae]
MFINELPDDCLLIIFGLINELDDLVNCYKVCSKWSHLIVERTRGVKYLVEHSDPWDEDVSPRYPSGYVYYQTEEPMDGACLSTLFPNLMIAEFSCRFGEKVKYQDIVTFVKRIKSVNGIINKFSNENESILQYCNQIEMLSTNTIEPCIKKNGVNIKQLHLWNYKIDFFKEDAHYFPNLERLHIGDIRGNLDKYYDGPIFRRLEIFEFLSSCSDIQYAFQFMDSCPNLQSAHICLQSHRIFVDGSVKHESLQDLVIEINGVERPTSFDWNETKRLFMKYPNLKYLSLWGYMDLENEHIEQLVRILPNLVLFDVRDCPIVTQKAADYVQGYNKLHGRSIKLYFNDNHYEIKTDWPHLPIKREKISQGFDFMKHCFLKSFFILPTFLMPSED